MVDKSNTSKIINRRLKKSQELLNTSYFSEDRIKIRDVIVTNLAYPL